MVFLFFCCISFIRVWCFPALAACLRCMVPARQVLAVKMKSEKKVKHHMVFLLFYCISCRCRLLEGFGFGFVFCLSFSCRPLEGFGCGDECAKKKSENGCSGKFWLWKPTHKKQLKRHIPSGVMFSGFSGLLEVYGSGTSWLWKWSQK